MTAKEQFEALDALSIVHGSSIDSHDEIFINFHIMLLYVTGDCIMHYLITPSVSTSYSFSTDLNIRTN